MYRSDVPQERETLLDDSVVICSTAELDGKVLPVLGLAIGRIHNTWPVRRLTATAPGTAIAGALNIGVDDLRAL